MSGGKDEICSTWKLQYEEHFQKGIVLEVKIMGIRVRQRLPYYRLGYRAR